MITSLMKGSTAYCVRYLIDYGFNWIWLCKYLKAVEDAIFFLSTLSFSSTPSLLHLCFVLFCSLLMNNCMDTHTRAPPPAHTRTHPPTHADICHDCSLFDWISANLLDLFWPCFLRLHVFIKSLITSWKGSAEPKTLKEVKNKS